MDRSKVPLAATIVNCQIGFINVLVRPLLSEWATFLGAEAERDVISSLEATLRVWETSGQKVIDSWGDFAVIKSDASFSAPTTGGGGKGGKGGKADGKGGKADAKAGPADSNRNVKQTM